MRKPKVIFEVRDSKNEVVSMIEFKGSIFIATKNAVYEYPKDECKHISDGIVYTSIPPHNKCKICGEFYK